MGQGNVMMRKQVRLCPLPFDVKRLKTEEIMGRVPQVPDVRIQAPSSTRPEMAPGVAIDQDLQVGSALKFTECKQGLPAPVPKPAACGSETVLMSLEVIRRNLAFRINRDEIESTHALGLDAKPFQGSFEPVIGKSHQSNHGSRFANQRCIATPSYFACLYAGYMHPVKFV